MQTVSSNQSFESSKRIFNFGGDSTEGSKEMREELGGKGANLAEMSSLGIPVPPGFTISTISCLEYFKNGNALSEDLKKQVIDGVKHIEKTIGKNFGDTNNPLLVSVRSGARVSMPGMMDTILNLGLNDTAVEGLAQTSGNSRFAWDSYRRFIQMYSGVVLGVNESLFEVALEDLKDQKGCQLDTELQTEDLKDLVKTYKNLVKDQLGRSFPDDPMTQLWGAIGAVFKSWKTPRAITYRRLHGYSEDWGTAVNIQSMVFGNSGDNSATGVAFTRDPSTGEKKFFGEYLINAQGEDVVAGIRTPHPISKSPENGVQSLEEVMPTAYSELESIYKKLEEHYKDMQDIEFTIENGKLWMLQTRTGKRTARAALKIALDLLEEGMIDEKTAILRIDPSSLDQLLHPSLDPNAERDFLTKGLPASPGAASGEIVFSSQEAKVLKESGQPTILVRIETSPEDIEGMVAAEGILTSRGGMTSHAAVVARGMGKSCVAGCGEMEVDYSSKTLRVANRILKSGDKITIDGSTGEVFCGEVKRVSPDLGGDFEQLMQIADKYRKLGIRTNADTPFDAKVARKFGAQGIGLCRTEHMFFAPERIDVVREMILADSEESRIKALDKLLPFQQGDFEGLFEAMAGYKVTIRLLDPPLHEFLPQEDNEIESLAKRLKVDAQELRYKVEHLHEFNPMLGHRGCRLAVTYPEIYAMQVRAIAQAVIEVKNRGFEVEPEIMIPLVADAQELEILRQVAESVIAKVCKNKGVNFAYQIGTMIELPRAALTSDQVASHADFFSFGTNDLTQTTLGLSRDDSGKFLSEYISRGIFSNDPFASIDQNGVGQLVSIGIEKGRSTKPDLKIGVCGEHGGDPQSIYFFNKLGLDYVSCSPYRVPIARLASAQAALK